MEMISLLMVPWVAFLNRLRGRRDRRVGTGTKRVIFAMGFMLGWFCLHHVHVGPSSGMWFGHTDWSVPGVALCALLWASQPWGEYIDLGNQPGNSFTMDAVVLFSLQLLFGGPLFIVMFYPILGSGLFALLIFATFFVLSYLLANTIAVRAVQEGKKGWRTDVGAMAEPMVGGALGFAAVVASTIRLLPPL